MNIISSNANVFGTSPFIHSQVLVKTEPADGKPIPSAPYLAGVDPATVGKVNVLPDSIKDGVFDLSDKGVVIGRGYAANNHLEVGDRIAVWSWRSLQKMDPTAGKTNA